MYFKSSPSWSIPSGRTPTKCYMTPGPGSYIAASENTTSTPAFTIGKSKRSELPSLDSHLGPASYTPTRKYSVKTAIFGSSPKRSLEISSYSPGPGKYNIRKSLEGPAFSIRGKDLGGIRQPTPGPGQYETLTRSGHSSFQFGRARRTFKVHSVSPGPGAYETLTRSNSKGVIFDRQKKVCGRMSESPGPGSYETPYSFLPLA